MKMEDQKYEPLKSIDDAFLRMERALRDRRAELEDEARVLNRRGEHLGASEKQGRAHEVSCALIVLLTERARYFRIP